jgi:hypothetical protein
MTTLGILEGETDEGRWTVTQASSEAARALAAQRRRVDAVCEECGDKIAGVVQRRFCSNRCAARAYRRRRQDATGGGGSIVDQLNAIRAEVMGGRVAADTSADLIREAREERTAAL